MSLKVLRLIIDTREKKLVDHFNIHVSSLPEGVSYSVDSLNVGDIHIGYGDDTYIFERKTLADLSQSVKDGRWHEQKQRMLSMTTSSRLCYIIEGCFDFVTNISFNGLTNDAFIGCIMNTLFRDNIKIVQTKHIGDTIHFVERLLKRISKNPETYYTGDEKDVVPGSQSYVPNVVKVKKKDNIDEEMCFLMQLCCIPSISYKTAERLSKHLGVTNMSELVKQLSSNENSIKYLCTVPGVGEVIASTIMKYLKIDNK